MADTTQIIGASVKVDASEAKKSVAELKDEVKLLTKELENAKGGTDQHAAALTKLKTSQEELTSTTNKQTAALSTSKENFSKLKDQIGTLPGPMKTAADSVEGLGKTFTSLLANPIVLLIAAIVAGLAFLYKSFTNTLEGGEKVEQVFTGIKAAAEVVLNTVFKLGGALIKFFTGHFKEAFEDAKAAVTGIGEAIVDAYDKASEAKKQIQKLDREQSGADLEKAKRQTRLVTLREELNDETISIADKKKAAEELKQDQIKFGAEDLQRAKDLAKAKIASLSITKEAEEKNLIEINGIKKTVEEQQTASETEQVRANKVIRNLDKQQKAEDKAAESAIKAEEKQKRDQLNAFNAQLNKLQRENDLAGITDKYKRETIILENKLKDERALIERDLQERKISRDQYNKLIEAQEINENLQRKALADKRKEDEKASEAKFQQDLSAIRERIEVGGLENRKQKELLQLDISHQKELAKAIKDYGDDAAKFAQIKQAIDDEFKSKRDALIIRHQAEDDKKEFERSKKHAEAVLKDPNSDLNLKLATLDLEQVALKKAFDKGLITEEEYNEGKRKLKDARLKFRDEERQAQQNDLGIASTTADNLSTIFGKSTALGKTFAVSSATINTISSAIKAFDSMADIPVVGPALGAVAAAAALVSGYENISKILAVQIPGQSSGGSVGSRATAPVIPAAPVAPQQASTRLNPNSINQMGQAFSGRAYVVDADVKNAADRNARLSLAATLGG